MTLTVSAKDFGPIIEGTVELKPLTVFVGPSNSGKSYLAMLIYALMQSIMGASAYGGGFPGTAEMRFRARRIARQVLAADGEISPAVKEDIDRWVQSVEFDEPKDYLETFVNFSSIPSGVQDIANDAIKTSLQAAVGWFDGELQRCHGKVSDLRRRSEDAALKVALQQSYPSLGLSFGEEPGHERIRLLQEAFDVSSSKVHIEPHLKLDLQRIKDRAARLRYTRLVEPSYHEFLSTVVQDAQSYLFENFPRNSYYLPAARSGIAQGHKAIASILVRQSSFAALQPLEIPTLSGVITDFISHILTMERGGRRRNLLSLEAEIAFLEKEVVRGKIDIEERGVLPYPEISYEPFAGQPTLGNFPFHKTSSMVSELAPVILFLKYLVRPGDLLILEEPESHLHPAIQRMMARAIARLVNAGVKVLITTHSDYFVGQLNNLLQVSRASRQKRKKEGFEIEDGLKPSDVSAYHFQPDDSAGGSRVISLTITPGFGIDAPDFAQVSEALYEETIAMQRVRG